MIPELNIFPVLSLINIKEFLGKYAILNTQEYTYLPNDWEWYSHLAHRYMLFYKQIHRCQEKGFDPFPQTQKECLMAIIFNENTKTITLHTKNTSYQMKIGNLDYLLHLYYGPSILDEDMNYQVMQYDRGFSGNPYESRNARTFSLDAQPQEFSTQQQGDFRTASIEEIGRAHV